jgi:hypothetical protein
MSPLNPRENEKHDRSGSEDGDNGPLQRPVAMVGIHTEHGLNPVPPQSRENSQ